ncbi:hypothetical protein MKQ70_27770 [Chitinophaga sedimenti]|uniref:hypothetical protein n=1 Tax=Chitinophaga sedimenti TaxID=2033606 RepID=UPI0020050CE7|nr:hypothetical protein [Chitinophaga sedimenti]MCK7558589.1 hypothetical protein [Chitinophaga sedimenti]
MKNRLLAIAILATAAGCHSQEPEKHSPLDSMTTGKDSVFAPVAESFKKDTLPKLDSVPADKIPGQWSQPVQGIDSLTQGFY